MSEETSQLKEWQPPSRPEWVQRINDEGRCMDISGVVPLDSESLINSAVQITGLSDFGDDGWREHFEFYVNAIEQEAELNLMGRLMTRSEILQLLTARLQVEEAYKQHPEIADEVISKPLIVIGQGRSGTSFLLNILEKSPDNGAARHWEMVFPCPPPEKATYRTDPRIAKADKLITQWNRVTPTLPSMHEFSAEVPMEDSVILAMSFLCPTHLYCLGQSDSYLHYVDQQDLMPALRYHQRVLKLLQWKNPRKHWVLKDPMHLDRIQSLLKLYPDACFIWPHRDPVRALASVINITGTVSWMRSDHPLKSESLKYMVDPNISAMRMNAVIEQLETGTIPKQQLFNMQYQDLVGNTLSTLQAMYEHFGINYSEEVHKALAQYLTDNPRDSRPSHRFDAGKPEDIAKARVAYQHYHDYFNVINE